MKKIVLLLLTLLLIGWIAYKSPLYSYYTDTYRGYTAYAIVPKDVPQRTETTDMSGKIIPDSYTYQYQFNFVLEDGTFQTMHYELSGESVTPIEPKSYIVAKISRKRVIEGPNKINQKDIPNDVLALLAQKN